MSQWHRLEYIILSFEFTASRDTGHKALCLVSPVPSRFVQTREAAHAAISDTYNGDEKVYAALRAAAYVSWGIVTSLGAPSDTGLRA